MNVADLKEIVKQKRRNFYKGPYIPSVSGYTSGYVKGVAF